MLKKALVILLIICFGLKNISFACQPLAQTLKSTRFAASSQTKDSTIFDLFISLFSGSDNQDNGNSKQLDDDIVYFQHNSDRVIKAVPGKETKVESAFITEEIIAVFPPPYINKHLSTEHSFIFRLSLF